MNINSIAYYRMPNEKDFYCLSSSSQFQENAQDKAGFFFSDFETKTIFSLKNPSVKKNIWLPFDFDFQPTDIEISKEDYLKTVTEITEKIQSKEFQKVVFSRIKNIQKPKEITLKKLFTDLCNQYPKAFVYCISSREKGTWLGASPELLIEKKGGNYQTMSLAGTRTEDVQWTKKEQREQQVVTQYIVNKITPFSDSIKISNPYDLNTGTVIHLKSDISFVLNQNKAIWKLVNTLNPTPAVCGIPTQKTKKYIRQIEPHNRNFYTGFIGVLGINSHSSLFVNLRCMQICETAISLYVGGGIMGDSEPEKEWAETENKAKTLLKVI